MLSGFFKHVKKWLYIIIPVLLLCIGYLALRNPFSYEALPLSESNKPVQNPYCGFFHLYGYPLSEKGTHDAVTWCQQMLENDTQSLVLLQINLRNYSNQSISTTALNQLDAILSTFAGADKQIILRFLYDWDGRALDTEPSKRSQILAHMEQTAPIVNAHAGHIFSLQGVFTGNCGEMNQTHYGTDDDIRILMEHLAKVTNPDIFLSVRTPSHLRTIIGRKDPLCAEESYSGTLLSRLGLYNDGIMGNLFDCGTYDDTSFATAKNPAEKGTREEEIAFQNQLCRYVPNGGEAILSNSLNDFPAAYHTLAAMHISYLSCDYDPNVLNKWKQSTYQGAENDVFNGCNGYETIEAHLGYRYVVTASDLKASNLLISLSNTGFAPCYRPFQTTLRITKPDTGKVIEVSVPLDNRTILPSGEETAFSVSLPNLPRGTYHISLAMKDSATDLAICFANENTDTEGSVLLGILTVR